MNDGSHGSDLDAMDLQAILTEDRRSLHQSCDVCAAEEFVIVGMRGDGATIVRCTRCGMGVLSHAATREDGGAVSGMHTPLPDSRKIGGGPDEAPPPSQEKIYPWIRSVAALLVPSGNSVDLGSLKTDTPVDDCVITAIGVYERSSQFSAVFVSSLAFIGQECVLLFQVPLISGSGDNTEWLTRSFENRYYPSEQALRHLLETRQGFRLAGMELRLAGGGATFIGAVSTPGVQADRIGKLFQSLRNGPGGLDESQKQAWLGLQLLCGGRSSPQNVRELPRLDRTILSDEVLAQIADVWLGDLARLAELQRCNEQLLRRCTDRELEIARMRAEMETVRHDARFNTAQATQAIVHEMERASMVAAKAAASEGRALEIQRAYSNMERLYREKDQELQAMRASTLWRITQPVRSLAHRYPGIARRARQAAKLMVWTAKFTVVRRVREVLRQRALARQSTPTEQTPLLPDFPDVRLLPSAGFFPDKQESWDYDVWPAGRPLVSIIVPCFNYGHLVAEAIRSAEEQTLPDIEIIVVEGGSDSVESRRGFVSVAQNAPSRVRVLLQEKPHRAGANRNFGISNARGKYICCLDADDRLAPTYLEKALFLLEHYGLDVVSPALQFFGDRTDIWMPDERPTLQGLLKGNQVLTCAVFRKSLWLRAGGFRDSDPGTGHIHEDWLFWTRLAALGARFQNMREPLLFYRSHGQTLSTSASVVKESLQHHYIAKFNADVLPPEGQAPSTEPEIGFTPVDPLRNLTRLSDRFRHRPSILLAAPYLVLGGAERLLSSVVAHLVENGWKVTIVTTVPTSDAQGDTTSWFAFPGVSVYHLPRFISPERWKDFTDYLFVTRQFQLLWIVGSAFFYDYLPALRDRYPELRVVDLLFNTVGHTPNNRRYSRYIDMNLVENRDVHDWLISAGEKEDRIESIASGVDLAKYSPGQKNWELLAEYGVYSPKVVVGFSGRWSEEKDPLAVIEIAARIPADLPVVFMMTGTGPMAQAVSEKLRTTSLPPGRVVVCGAVPEMVVYLRSYDVLLLPSKVDGRPNVVMEALACGVPVVASRVGALPELVDDGVQGYLCEPGAYGQFASRIIELACDAKLLGRFKHSARIRAERSFDVHDMQRAYAQVFERLLS